MSTESRTIVKLFLIAVTFSLSNFAAVSLLNAAQIEDDSSAAIQIDEVELEKVEEPEVDSEPAAEKIAAANTDAIQILTKESFTTWINPLIFLFLVVCFLCWLLALFTRKPTGEVSGSADESAGQNVTTSSLTASNSAASNAAATNDEKIGRVFTKKPATVDDLTKIGGIEAHDAKRLNEAGIWQYEQLRSMTAQQRANLQRRLNLPHIRWYSLAGLSDVSTASLATESKNSLTASGKTATTRVDSVAPKDSVGSPKLQFSTGAKASETVASTVGQGGPSPNSNQGSGASISTGKSGSEGAETAKVRVDSAAAQNESVGSPKFNSQAGVKATAAAATTGSSVSIGGPAADGKSSLGGGITKGGNATTGSNSSATTTAMSGAGSSAVAHGETKGDDLTRLAGIDSAAAERLNAAGIFSFDQLKGLDDQQASQLAEKCRIPNADVSDWRRCIYAWGRGIETTSETDETFASGTVHGIELPQIADGVFDGEKLVAYPEQVIFRGSNPEGWGRGGRESIDGVEASLSCDSIRSDINFLRIRRTDTRESVIVPMTKGQLFANGDPSENGWNGSSEVFFGGRHIGVFAQHLPQEVETKFSQGGWGFGHRYDHNDRQEWGWAGRVIEPTSFEVSVGCIGDTPGTVVFRGSDPSIWNTKARDGDNCFADPIDSVKHPVNFVRIMRQATGEAVIVRVDGNHVLDEGFDPRCGWNGSCSEFSGGQHLGVYHCDLAQDFETRFEFGGWGFGHPYNDNDRQAWGWAGRQLPETVFEISLLESVPGFMQHELVE